MTYWRLIGTGRFYGLMLRNIKNYSLPSPESIPKKTVWGWSGEGGNFHRPMSTYLRCQSKIGVNRFIRVWRQRSTRNHKAIRTSQRTEGTPQRQNSFPTVTQNAELSKNDLETKNWKPSTWWRKAVRPNMTTISFLRHHPCYKALPFLVMRQPLKI